jgi:hypothetical protein
VAKAPSRRKPNVDNDLGRLAPSFRRKVERLLELMRNDGWHPLVWETYRTPERAADLATDKLKGASMHSLGLAVDIVDEQLLWGASEEFKQALGRHAKALGLYWGGDFLNNDGSKGRDQWHVQAIPIGQQNRYRALTTLAARESLLQRRWGIA